MVSRCASAQTAGGSSGRSSSRLGDQSWRRRGLGPSRKRGSQGEWNDTRSIDLAASEPHRVSPGFFCLSACLTRRQTDCTRRPSGDRERAHTVKAIRQHLRLVAGPRYLVPPPSSPRAVGADRPEKGATTRLPGLVRLQGPGATGAGRSRGRRRHAAERLRGELLHPFGEASAGAGWQIRRGRRPTPRSGRPAFSQRHLRRYHRGLGGPLAGWGAILEAPGRNTTWHSRAVSDSHVEGSGACASSRLRSPAGYAR
jgi:hypothetical protein